MLDRRQVYATCGGLRLVQYYEHLHFHGFVWLLLVICIILLYNHVSTEIWKPCANRELMCALENFQWSGESYFAGAAISVDGCLPQTSRYGKHIMILLISPLWRVNLMLALNRSFLNRECSLINAHFYVISPCNFLIEDYTEIFFTVYKCNVSSI
jgi:hypothetical protein